MKKYKHFNFKILKMKKTRIITTLLISCLLFLNGCMTTWPIVDDLDHYKKWDTYESIREEKEQSETIIEENTKGTTEDETEKKAIENCINSRNNDPTLYEDEAVIELYNQFENTEDFCTEFVKTNPMFYNNIVWIDESWEPIWQDWEIIEN